MQSEIICIGTELLLGHIVNTNATYISQKLAEIGINLYYHSVVGDNPERLGSILKASLERSDIIITTGGLGPTVDDITLETISKVTHRPLILNRKELRRIKDRFRYANVTMPKTNIRQAYIPKGAIAISNKMGTAPGLIIESPPHPSLSHKGERVKVRGKVLIALPGVPLELTHMMEDTVIPYLKKRFYSGGIIKSRTLKIVGMGESKVNEEVADLLKMSGDVTVGIYAHTAQVDLKITTKAIDEFKAIQLISPVEDEIRKRLGNYIFGADNDTLESIVASILTENKLTISVAESCTGGLLSKRLTDIPGSSAYFKMGIIVYSNKAKIKKLNVPKEMLKRYGAVSKQVAIAMADGVRKVARTDIGISITGIAGPAGATKTKPVGLVYIALSKNPSPYPLPQGESNKMRGTSSILPICKRFNFQGTRETIRFKATQSALDMIRDYISKYR